MHYIGVKHHINRFKYIHNKNPIERFKFTFLKFIDLIFYNNVLISKKIYKLSRKNCKKRTRIVYIK